MKKILQTLFIIVFLSSCSLFEKAPTPVTPEVVIPEIVIEAKPRLYGIGNLGLCKYEKDVAKEGHEQGFANVTFVDKTFCPEEKTYKALDELLATGKVPFNEYNLSWHDNHSFKRSDFPSIVNRAKKFSVLAEKYPNIECAFSGATEHNLNKADATELANRVLEVIPQRCVYVNNPLANRGSFIEPGPRKWNETHGAGANPPPVGGKFIWSFDGSDMFDYVIYKVIAKVKNAEVAVGWTSQNNGRLNRNDTTPRPQRKAYPVVKLLKAQAFAMLHQQVGKLKNSKYTIKPKSDQHEAPKPEYRALKPVFILPINADRIELRAGGKKIITSEGRQPFDDGRSRYYFSQMFGYEIVEKAKQVVLDIFANGKKIGTANPGQRQ